MQQGYKVIANIAKNDLKLDQKIKGKDFLLGKYYANKKISSKPPKPKCFCSNCSVYLDSKIKNMLHTQDKLTADINQQKSIQYFKPLNKLWEAYMSDLIDQQKSQESCLLKILRSDFHGAYIKVVYSKVISCIGICGIVFKQSLKTFKLITEENRQVTLLKSVHTFMITIAKRNFIVHGGSLLYRPSDRSKHKFKFKKAEKMNLQFLQFLIEEQQNDQ